MSTEIKFLCQQMNWFLMGETNKR